MAEKVSLRRTIWTFKGGSLSVWPGVSAKGARNALTWISPTTGERVRSAIA
jgi:hypothetical protein